MDNKGTGIIRSDTNIIGNDILIPGINLIDLKPNPDDRGFLMEIARSDWPQWNRPEMIYFSKSHPGVIRAWHRHSRGQVDYFCCAAGMIKVAVYDDLPDSPTSGRINEFFIGENNWKLLKVPGKYWHGFAVVGNQPALLINMPTRLYDYVDPDEERLAHDTKEIDYDWTDMSRWADESKLVS